MKANMDYETLRNSMTVQDAVRVLKETNCYGTMDIAKTVIIKALEQQPNEDCISRKEAIDALKQQAENMLCWSGRYTEQRKGILIAINIVSDLLSVTPQPKEEPQQKTGHWIEHKHGGIEHIECSECGVWFLKADLPRKSYCPNCGSCNGDMIKNIMRDITKQ